MFLITKLNLKILINLFLILAFLCCLYYKKDLNYFFKSQLDPNYWLQKINYSNNGLDGKVYNVFILSQKNQKYRNKALINFIYHYENINNEERSKIISLI